MSLLYYANLNDVPKDVSSLQFRAVSNLMEFKDYLFNAKRSLEEQEYSIEWEFIDSSQLAYDYCKIKIPHKDISIEINGYNINLELNENSITKSNKINQKKLNKWKKKIEKLIFPTKKNQYKYWIRLKIPDVEEGDMILNEFLNTNEIKQNTKENYEKRKKLQKYPNFYRKIKDIPELLAICFDEKPFNNYNLYIKPSTYTIDKQIEAINELQSKPKAHHRPLIRLIENYEYSKWPIILPIEEPIWEKLKKLDEYPDTLTQRKFVKKALSTPDFAFLEGPPGSGKTFTICELIIQLIRQNKKVLLVASTHVAVDNVLEDLIKYKNEIIPVRIGKEKNISEKIIPYRYENQKKTIKKKLIQELQNIEKPLECQKYLLDALNSSNSDLISNIILKTSNLACGTTIGILKHPDFRKVRNTDDALFDVMILDEASKTPFAEFLVPALFARRWIIVGDIRQLSPYVEKDQVESNIKGIISSNYDKVICTDLYYLRKNFTNWLKNKRNKLNKILIVSESEDLLIKYKDQSEFHGIPYIFINEKIELTIETKLSLHSSILLLIKKNRLIDIEPYLSPDIDIIRGDFNSELFSKRRSEYFLNFDNSINNKLKKKLRGLFWKNTTDIWKNLPNLAFDKGRDNKYCELWSSEVSWRLIRKFETKLNDENQKYLENEINNLLPIYYHQEKIEDINKQFSLISSVAFPSILEILQIGYTRSSFTRSKTILSEGFPGKIFNKRHEILHFQNRMHSDISKFPRDHFYLEENALLDTEDLDSKRQWNYPIYSNKPRVFWITYSNRIYVKKNVNLLEIDIIMEELEKFCNWAKTQKHPTNEKGIWEIAVLTFYRGQEGKLRSSIQKKYKIGAYQDFPLNSYNVHIKLCTVDRFQGHEADLVFLSFVKTRGIGFLNNPNRLNVALTRAKYQLVLIGSVKNFESQKIDNNLRYLVNEIKIEQSLSKIRNEKRSG